MITLRIFQFAALLCHGASATTSDVGEESRATDLGLLQTSIKTHVEFAVHENALPDQVIPALAQEADLERTHAHDIEQKADPTPGQEPLPPGWAEYLDPQSGKPYYFESSSKTSTWERPAASAQRQAYDSKVGRAACSAKEVLHSGIDFASEESVQQKCSELHCAFYVWANDGGSKYNAWFCSSDYYDVVDNAAVWSHWKVGRPITLAGVLKVARGLKFYAPGSTTCMDQAFAGQVEDGLVFPDGVRVDSANGILSPVTRSLWANDENLMDGYVKNRLACGGSTVSSIEEADLCYPSCTQNLIVDKVDDATKNNEKWMMKFCFEVPSSRRSKWRNCKSVCFHPEAFGKCSMEVPYLHGITWPRSSSVDHLPWEFNFARKTLLTYFGGNVRGAGTGTDRDGLINTMHAAATNISASSPEAIFTSHILREENNYIPGRGTPQFYRTGWELYASANFSFQPPGDTPTRRAVYDSLMFGCVPVIAESSAKFYRRLFHGGLWSKSGVQLEDVFVVMPNEIERDGWKIVEALRKMPASEVEQRRLNLRRIAPLLQWSWNGPSDAFLTALGSFVSLPAPSDADLPCWSTGCDKLS